VERRNRHGYYFCKLSQLTDLWQQFCDLDEEVQQAALHTEDEYASRQAGLKKLVEKYQQVFKAAVGNGLLSEHRERFCPSSARSSIT